MTKLKKIIIYSILGFMFFITIIINFDSNSVYYSNNINTSNKDDVIMKVANNITYINLPSIPGYEYSENSVEFKEDNKEKATLALIRDGYSYMYSSKNNIDYFFNNKFNIYYAYNQNTSQVIDITKINKENVKQEIYEFLKPIIDSQPKPLINMQWLFNYMYKDVYK